MAKPPSRLLAALVILADAVLGVDIDRPDEALFPERTRCRHGPAQLAQADGGDFHGLDALGCGLHR